MTLEEKFETLTEQMNALISVLTSQNNFQSKYSIFEWLDVWYNEFKYPELHKEGGLDNGLRNIRSCINVHIKPFFENKNMSLVQPLEIQRCLNMCKNTRTKKYTFDVFNSSFRQAFNLGYLKENPMQRVPRVIHVRNKGRAITAEEQRLFIKAIKKNKMETLYKFYLLTGVRRNEALTINPLEDIDIQNRSLRIRGTKTINSYRQIPITAQLAELLKSLDLSSPKLFNYSSNAVTQNFKRLAKKNNFTFTIHSLRHTFATRCIELGISIKVVQKWLGHSKASFTMNTYVDVLSEFEELQIKKINIKI